MVSNNGENYSAMEGVFHMLRPCFNGAADGTGAYELVKYVKNLLGPQVAPVIIDFVIGQQNNIMGSYAAKWEVAPSGVFTVLFFIEAVLHLTIFVINFTRGHYFSMSILWMLTCLMTSLGFLLRLVHALDLTKVAVVLTSEVFLIVPSIIFVSLNLMLTQRLFTWRHPVGGSRRLFWNTMITLYIIVLILLGVTVAASFIPYLHYLSNKAYGQWKTVVRVTSVFIILYSLTSIALLFLSYFFKPTRKDDNLYTYQPWWIKSFHPLYFVEKNAAQKAEETFMKRNHNHRHAIRVIAATHHHYNMVEGLTNERGSLRHNTSLIIIISTTILIFCGAVNRCIVVFENNTHLTESTAASAWVGYAFWGIFEVLINLFYIVGRVDLRFYRPDNLPAKVRAIITAEQSYYPSDDESYDVQNSMVDQFSSSTESSSTDEYNFQSGETQEKGSDPELPYPYPKENVDLKNDKGVDENAKYPTRKEPLDDDESEFYF